jgi:hypothetical protein
MPETQQSASNTTEAGNQPMKAHIDRGTEVLSPLSTTTKPTMPSTTQDTQPTISHNSDFKKQLEPSRPTYRKTPSSNSTKLAQLPHLETHYANNNGSREHMIKNTSENNTRDNSNSSQSERKVVNVTESFINTVKSNQAYAEYHNIHPQQQQQQQHQNRRQSLPQQHQYSVPHTPINAHEVYTPTSILAPQPKSVAVPASILATPSASASASATAMNTPLTSHGITSFSDSLSSQNLQNTEPHLKVAWSLEHPKEHDQSTAPW